MLNFPNGRENKVKGERKEKKQERERERKKIILLTFIFDFYCLINIYIKQGNYWLITLSAYLAITIKQSVSCKRNNNQMVCNTPSSHHTTTSNMKFVQIIR